MRSLIVAVVIIAAIFCVNAELTDEQKQKLIENGKACISETGVDSEAVKKARGGDFNDEDAKLKDFARCMAGKSGFQDASGEPIVEVIKQKLASAIGDAAAAEKLVEKCVIKKSTPEETAYETFKCYYANTPTHVVVF